MDLEKKNKEIEEMAEVILKGITPLQETYSNAYLAELLYEAGYRKQIEGEWMDVPFPNNPRWEPNKKCSICGRVVRRKTENYCPRCGARMKGEQ